MKRRYYTAEVPRDAYDVYEDAFDLAVVQIKERMKKYYSPANWRLIWVRGDLVRVCLEANN